MCDFIIIICENDSQIEKLFSTRISVFNFPEAGTKLLRVHPDDNLTMPIHLGNRLQFVSQVVFPIMRGCY